MFDKYKLSDWKSSLVLTRENGNIRLTHSLLNKVELSIVILPQSRISTESVKKNFDKCVTLIAMIHLINRSALTKNWNQ